MLKDATQWKQVLGRGAFATVYLGTVKGEKVAVKVGNPELENAGDENTRQVSRELAFFSSSVLLRFPRLRALVGAGGSVR